MEPRTRNVWIIVVLILVGLCCCALAIAGAAVGGFGIWSSDYSWGGSTSFERERLEQSFDVGDAPGLEIDNFAGSVTVRAGEGDTIRVVATKRATRRSDLDRIQVEMSERDGGLVIKTQKSSGLNRAWVELEITTPTRTRLELHSGSGSVDVRGLRGDAKVVSGSGSLTIADMTGDVDVHSGSGSLAIANVTGRIEADSGSGSMTIVNVTGEIGAHCGSGGIDVRQAAGPARLGTASGSIDYQGTPQGDCRYETTSGSVRLVLPADLNMEVDLSTGSGSVNVDYAVDGRVTRRAVKGTIGVGNEGKIYAHTGSGNIDVIHR